MIKLVAVDLDDTLLKDDGTLGERTVRAVRSAIQNGITVVPATGRAASSALPYAKQLGICGPIISYQGALISSHEGEPSETWLRRAIPVEDALEVVRLIRPTGLYLQTYDEHGLYFEAHTEQSTQYCTHTGVAGQAVGPLDQYIKAPQLKLLVFAEPQQVAELYPRMTRHFAGRLAVTISKPYYLEFTHPLATKGEALAFVAQKLGFEQGETAAIGDSFNDLTMLEWAAQGLAVENAAEPAKRAADRIIPSNEQEGVACILEEWVRQRNGR